MKSSYNKSTWVEWDKERNECAQGLWKTHPQDGIETLIVLMQRIYPDMPKHVARYWLNKTSQQELDI